MSILPHLKSKKRWEKDGSPAGRGLRKLPRLTAGLISRDGSALIWSMVVVIVLLLLVGVMATVVQTSYHSQKRSQSGNQAYYTARSVSESILKWLENTPETEIKNATEQQKFIKSLESNEKITETYEADDLDPSGEGKMGTAEAEISIDVDDSNPDQRNTVIKVTVTGHFAGDSETIVSYLRLGTNSEYTYQNPGVKTYDGDQFDPDDAEVSYGAIETELNDRPRDSGPVIVGNESLDTDKNMAKYNDNSEDQKTVDAAITSADSNRELTWLNRSSGQNTTLGTTYYPIIGQVQYQYSDIRRLVTPKNGRWTINPLQIGGNVTSADQVDSATAEENTRLISLSMGDFREMDAEIRFGGYNTGSDSTLLKNGTNYYNSLLMFDFTDNKGETMNNPYVEYYDNNDIDKGVSHLWHPQKWKSMTMYTQYTSDSVVNGGVNARLVFGPYAHKYNEYVDYWNWGRYVGNPWYGQKVGDMNKAFPGNDGDDDPSLKRVGMTYMPEYFGNDFRMFFLDDINENVLIIQGVNILGTDAKHSVIYSRRGVELGGGLVKSTSTYSDTHGATTRHVNSHVDGMSYGYAPTWPNYFGITTRYSQIIYNTDIVLLKGPDNGSRASTILDANLPNDGAYGENVHTSAKSNNNFSDNENKRFSPTVKIIGGYIYVGDKHKLTISGGRTNPLNGLNEETLTVSPTSITVEEGGTLIINASTGTNATAKPVVNTDIYANGEVTLDAGAKAKGNLIVSGTVSFGEAARYDGDIYINEGGKFTIGKNAVVVGDIQVENGGTLTVESGANITGDVNCAGNMELKGSITLNHGSVLEDNPSTPDVDESDPRYHGIFIYSSPNSGYGTLEVTGTPTINGNSGGIHSFPGYPGLTHAQASASFCDHRSENNACMHWTSVSNVWGAE